MKLRLGIPAAAVFYFPGINNVAEIKGFLFLRSCDAVTDVAADALIGAGAGRRWLRRNISGQIGQRCVAADATRFYLGYFLKFEGLGQCQFEIFHVIPGMSERLGHQALLPFSVDFRVADAALFRLAEIIISKFYFFSPLGGDRNKNH